MTSPNNDGRRSDGRFASGNKLGGNKAGSRHRVTRAIEALLEGQYEMLTAKLKEAAENPPEITKTQKAAKAEESTFEKMANSSVTKSIMRTAGNTIVRSLLGSLGLGGRTTRKKGTNWF